MVISPGQSADLHMAQLMPLPLSVSSDPFLQMTVAVGVVIGFFFVFVSLGF